MVVFIHLPCISTDSLTQAKFERLNTDTLEVWHLEEDQFRPGYILFSETSALKQLNTNTWQLSTLVGETTSHSYTEGEGTSARFNVISGFVQVNSTYSILVDQGNHCIRGVLKSSRRSRLGVLYNTSHLAGTCGQSGNDATKFNTPSKIIKAPKKDRFYISDYGNIAIREFNLVSGDLTIWHTFFVGFGPVSIALRETGILYMITSKIVTVHMIINENSALSATGRVTAAEEFGYLDGSLLTAKFYFPQEIAFLNDSLLLVADKGNNRLGLVDTKQAIVSTICDGSRSGNNSSICTMPGAQALAVTANGAFYVGTKQGIWKVTPFKSGEQLK